MTYYPKETYVPDMFAAYCINNKLKINLDTSHVATLGYDINEFFIKYHTFINLIHLSDFDGKRQHLPFGKGKLHLKQLFKNMKKLSYKGDIIFELYIFPNQSQEQIQEEISHSLKLFKAYFK